MKKPNPFDIERLERESAEAEAEARARQKQYAEDLAETVRSRASRHIIWSWLQRYGLNADTFDTNAMMMSRKSGARLVVLEIAAEIKAAHPKEFALMEAENA